MLDKIKFTGNIRIIKDKVIEAVDMPEMHCHECYELYFLLSGERRYFIGHTVYEVSPGDVVVIPRNELHCTGAYHGKGYDRYVVYFSEEYAREIAQKTGSEAFKHFMDSGCIQMPPEHAEKVRKSLKLMEWENKRQDSYYDAMTENIFCNIVLTIMRHGKIKQRKHEDNVDKIQEAARYISMNYSSGITLSSAAKIACMEDTYFSKKFKSLTGFGFSEYLIQTRVKAAEELLMFSDLGIGEIAEQCGFSGSNYFGDVFKKWKGISPSEYRKINKI